MIAIDAVADARRGRIFIADLQSPDLVTKLRERFAHEFIDSDAERLVSHLEKALRAPVVTAAVHQGIDPDDIVQVFLETNDPLHPRVFACTVVSESRLQHMVENEGVIFEGFDLQVASGPFLSMQALHSALEAWSARNFSGRRTRFNLSPWSDDASVNLLAAMIDTSGQDLQLLGDWGPSEIRPKPEIAQPPWHDAA